MRSLILGSVLAVTFGAAALDNTVSNEFWNTTAYVNAQPSTLSLVVTTGLDLSAPSSFASVPQRDFDSHAPGLFFVVR